MHRDRDHRHEQLSYVSRPKLNRIGLFRVANSRINNRVCDRQLPKLTSVFDQQRGLPVPLLAQAPRMGERPGDWLSTAQVCGMRSVITVEARADTEGIAAIYVDAARVVKGGSYDWPNKITLVLTSAEMLRVLAVFLKYLPGASGRNHGDHRDTWFEVAHQASHVLLKIGQGKTVHSVPIGPEDSFRLAALLAVQVRKNMPEGAAANLSWLLRQILAPMAHSASG